MAVIREYAWGVESSCIARVSEIPRGHIEDALHRLRSEGFVASTRERMSWYYGSRETRLWRELFRPELLGRPLPRFVPGKDESDRIPPQFWWVFWSGPDPMFLRLSENAWYIASRMLAPEGSTRFLPAETWALRNVPTSALQQLLNGRGYKGTPVGERMELAISQADTP